MARYEIDSNDPNTLKNRPNSVPQWFQDELQGIDKTLRCVWGQSEFTFACEMWIPKYRSGVVREEKIKHFRLRNIVTQEETPCGYETAKRRWELTQAKDFLDDYVRSETYTEIQLEPIGLPRFIIEQYFPPDKIKDTPENWERNRYKLFSPHHLFPEKMTDIIGEFPFSGRYEGFHIVKEDNGERFGKFRDIGQGVLEDVRHLWKTRDSWKQTKSSDLMVRDVFEQAQIEEAKFEMEVADRLKSEFAPHAFRGTYMSQGDPLKMNKRTKFGRAK